MDSYSGSKLRKFTSFRLGKENDGRQLETSIETDMEPCLEQRTTVETYVIEPTGHDVDQDRQACLGTLQLQETHGQSLISRFFATDSSGSNESCETNITCKMNQLAERVAKHYSA